MSPGKKATKPKKVPAASSKKLEDDERKKKQPGLLASLQAAMEEEVGASRIEADRTESPDMFDSEEENSDKTGKEKAAGGKEKVKQSKKPKKNEASESCKAGSKETEESESEDSGEDMGNSRSRMIGRQLEKELENSSVAGGGTGSKEKAGGNSSK